MSPVRLFFALWPDESVKLNLVTAVNKFPAKIGRKIDKDKLHITLLFLGSVSMELIEPLNVALREVNARPFSLVIDCSGWWRQSGVLWLGPAQVPGELVQLVAVLGALVGKFGIPVESRPYQPHITIARKSVKPVKQPVFAPIAWEVREFCLVESITHSVGAEYRILKRWPLTLG